MANPKHQWESYFYAFWRRRRLPEEGPHDQQIAGASHPGVSTCGEAVSEDPPPSGGR